MRSSLIDRIEELESRQRPEMTPAEWAEFRRQNGWTDEWVRQTFEPFARELEQADPDALCHAGVTKGELLAAVRRMLADLEAPHEVV